MGEMGDLGPHSHPHPYLENGGMGKWGGGRFPHPHPHLGFGGKICPHPHPKTPFGGKFCPQMGAGPRGGGAPWGKFPSLVNVKN